MKDLRLIAVVVALAIARPCSAQAAGDASRGAALFEDRCAFCHAPAGGGQGPSLAAVYGRKAASLPGFAYSDALKRSGLTWTRATLERFLAGPAKMVPGTPMMLTLPDAQQQADIIAYLAKR